MAAGRADVRAPGRDCGGVHEEQPRPPRSHTERLAHHSVRAAVREEAAYMGDVAAHGTSDSTPLLLIAGVLALVLPFVVLVVLLAFGIADFS